MGLADKEIEEMIKEIKEKVAKQMPEVTEKEKENLMIGLKERLAKIPEPITTGAKNNLIKELSERMMKEIHLYKAGVFQYLCDKLPAFLLKLPDNKLNSPIPIMEFNCPDCKKYNLRGDVNVTVLTKKKQACTLIINFRCMRCYWEAHSIGIFYISGKGGPIIRPYFYGGFSLEEELRREKSNCEILYS